MRFNRFLEANLSEALTSFALSNLKADIFLGSFLRSKKIGKRDRLWVSDRFYFYLRHKFFFDEISTVTTIAKNIAMMFDNEPDEFLTEKTALLKSSDDFENLYNRSFSPFVKKRITEYYGDGSFNWFNTKSDITIRTNLKKIDREGLIKKLSLENFEVEKTPLSPAGITVLSGSSNLRNSPLFEQGLFEFQDESSQIASLLVNKDSKTFFDCCAGGGGKSLAVKSFFPDVSVTASDIRVHLFKEIEERSKRAGIKIQTAGYQAAKTTSFDTVFIDAPCSGSGVLRRNPADRYLILEESVKELVKLQSEILLKFSQNVKSSGELIYVTCSFIKEENEEIIEKFLLECKDFKLISAAVRLIENGISDSSAQSVTSDNYFRTLPFSQRDLMFGAILKKMR